MKNTLLFISLFTTGYSFSSEESVIKEVPPNEGSICRAFALDVQGPHLLVPGPYVRICSIKVKPHLKGFTNTAATETITYRYNENQKTISRTLWVTRGPDGLTTHPQYSFGHNIVLTKKQAAKAKEIFDYVHGIFEHMQALDEINKK